MPRKLGMNSTSSWLVLVHFVKVAWLCLIGRSLVMMRMWLIGPYDCSLCSTGLYADDFS